MDLRRQRLLREVVGLDGPIEPSTDDLVVWTELAQRERVIPLLFAITERRGRGNAQAFSMVADAQLEVMGRAVAHEHVLLEATAALNRAGVPSVVLKGAATAHLDYPDPSLRQFADIDVLVAPTAFAEARSVLERLAWRQAYALPAGHETFTHAVTFRRPGGGELDLHQRVAHRALGRLLETDELLQSSVPFEIAGHCVFALHRYDRLVHAALHADTSRGAYRRLSSVADVLLLSRAQESESSSVLDRAERWRVRPLVEAAIRRAHLEAGLALGPGWTSAMAQPLRRRDRLVELAYLGPERRAAWEEFAHLRRLTSWRDRATYLRGYLVPDATYEAHHERAGLSAQARYLWSRLRDRGTG